MKIKSISFLVASLLVSSMSVADPAGDKTKEQPQPKKKRELKKIKQAPPASPNTIIDIKA